jgi:hypothetical protein
MPAEASTPVGIDREVDATAPVESTRITGQGFNIDTDIDPCQATQLLTHHRRLESTLRWQGSVLEVASAAGSGATESTRWVNAVGRGLDDLDRVAPQEARRRITIRDADLDALAGKGMSHEDNPALVTAHAMAAVRHAFDVNADD